MPLRRCSSTRARSLFALGLACTGALAVADAHATITCQSSTPTVTVLAAWNQNPNWEVAVGAPITTAWVEVKYMVRKSGAATERVAVRTNWAGNLHNWSAASNSMKFVEGPGDAKGFGLQILATGDGNLYTTPSEPGRGLIHEFTSASATYTPVYTRFFFIITKYNDATESGDFGLFGDSFHWGLDQFNGTSWTPVPGASCGTGGGGVMTFDMLAIALAGIGKPKPPEPDPVACTINGGLDISYPLPAVASATMDQIGILPIGYSKQPHTISYKCTGAAVTDPVFTMALVGQKAGTTNALASTNPRVGVMVEAIDGRNGALTVMTPNPTASSAEKVRIYDAGSPAGSTLSIQAYPVRSETGTIDAGNFTATGTLKIFTK